MRKQVAELVECPDCKKKLTAKTFKYNHVHNCPAKRFTAPTTESTIEQPTEPVIVYSNEPLITLPSEPVERQPTVRELRAMKRKIMIDSLMSQAFYNYI